MHSPRTPNTTHAHAHAYTICIYTRLHSLTTNLCLCLCLRALFWVCPGRVRLLTMLFSYPTVQVFFAPLRRLSAASARVHLCTCALVHFYTFTLLRRFGSPMIEERVLEQVEMNPCVVHHS